MEIAEFKHNKTYEYLGINEANGINHTINIEEFYKRKRTTLRIELNTKNKVIAINSLTIPVVTFSFNLINWTFSEIKKVWILKFGN